MEFFFSALLVNVSLVVSVYSFRNHLGLLVPLASLAVGVALLLYSYRALQKRALTQHLLLATIPIVFLISLNVFVERPEAQQELVRYRDPVDYLTRQPAVDLNAVLAETETGVEERIKELGAQYVRVSFRVEEVSANDFLTLSSDYFVYNVLGTLEEFKVDAQLYTLTKIDLSQPPLQMTLKGLLRHRRIWGETHLTLDQSVALE